MTSRTPFCALNNETTAILVSCTIETFFLEKSFVLFQQICLAVGYYALRMRAHRLSLIATEQPLK